MIATKALLLKHPSPSEEEIYEGLKNNYCRCTGYVKIIEAIKLSAARLRGEDPGIDDFRTRESSVIVVGKDQAIPQVEGSALGKSIWDVDGLAKTGGTDVHMTHDQIARYMGSAREVVSRLLKYFAGEGLVRLYRGGVTVLDKERLKQIANGA